MNDPPSVASSVREGDLLDGKYRVERVLGVGGMGVVVAAHHVQLESKVALKFLLPAMLADHDAVGRFAREAKAAARISSDHVARVLDVGTLENGAPYMVMEFLEGVDLAHWLERHGRMPIEDAVDFTLQALLAVAEAHRLGIVHRDLKPANLFCIRRTDGSLFIKVLDFGISKLAGVDGGGLSMTRTTATMGSPLYMSPEQMQSSKNVGTQTDIWALGVVLHELLAGSPPFTGETLPELAIKVAIQPPPRLRTLRPDAPAGLEAVVLRCLEKDTARRYRHVGELAVGLAEFAPERSQADVQRILGIVSASGHPVSAVQPSTLANTAAVPSTMAALGRSTSGKSGRPGGKAMLALGFGVGLLALGSAGTALLLHRWPAQAGVVGPPRAASPEGLSSLPPPPPAPTVAAAPAVETLRPEPVVPRPSVADVATEASSHRASHAPLRPASANPPAGPGAVETSSRVGVAPPTKSSAAPALDCTTPYYYDAAGNRVFKPECVE